MMATPPPAPMQLARDLNVALSFSTRLPVPHAVAATGADVARACWALPIAGALVGAIGALVYGLAVWAAIPAFPAAALAVAATVLATGALHEDGFADVADGFGGGATRERKLEIMRDSRLGTYGACALGLSLILRISAIADLTQPALVASALLAAHIGARAAMPAVMWFVPPAKPDGLSASAGLPPVASVVIAAASAHRADAFRACRYAIERVKQIAPIWKREFFDGGDVWIEGATADPDDEAARARAEQVACG